MVLPLDLEYSRSRLPSIVITPAIPSPCSLPAEMRSTLDSILERRPSGYPAPRRPSSYRRPVPVLEDESENDEHEEAPCTTPTTRSPTTEGSHFRLVLDFGDARFSCGDVLSAMNAAGERALQRRSAAVRNSTARNALARMPSRPQSSWESNYVVFSNIMSLKEDEDEDSCQEPHIETDSGLQPTHRRPQSPAGQVPQEWREALYVGKPVWPHKTNSEKPRVWRNKPLPPIVAAPKSRWEGAGMLVRKLSRRRN